MGLPSLSEKQESARDGSSTPPTPFEAAKAARSASGNEDNRNSQRLSQQLSRQLSRVATSDYPTGLRLGMIVVALILTMFLVALDMTIVATAIPKVTSQFNSLEDIGWYGSAFFLTLASFQSTWGKAYKYFPLKIAYLISVFIFEVGSLICAVAQNSPTLIVGRAIAGAGGAGIASGSYTIIAFSAPEKQRPAFTGLLGATYGIASVIGPVLGGVFTDNLTWRWCFYINLPIGGVAAAIIVFFFTTPTAARPQDATLKEKILQMDFPGSIVIMGSFICYLLAMQWGGVRHAWSSGTVIALLVLFVVLLAVFIGIEWRSGSRALLQFRFLKDRTIAGQSLYAGLVAGSFFVLIYYLPIYFQSTRGHSASQSGIDNLPLVLGASIFTIISGITITVTGHYIPLMILGSSLATAGTALIYTFEIETASPRWIGYQALGAAGLGLSFQIPIIVNQAITTPSELSSVTAQTLFGQTLSGAIFVSAAQSAFTNTIIKRVAILLPELDPGIIIATGADALRETFEGEQLQAVLAAYMDGLKVTFAIALATAAAGFVVAFTPRWESLKGKVKVDMGGA